MIPLRNHPTTADVIYNNEETEFLLAVDTWKREKNVKFPTLIELFKILKGLGYIKLRILK